MGSAGRLRAARQAEVTLPADASPREICLACQLLGETVRLRRRISREYRTRRRFSRLAMTDPLTGLANRRAWERELRVRLRPAAQQRAAGQCLAILDVDLFKQVNDRAGFVEGDRLLAAIAAALRDSVRADDFLARLGGDEFGLLLANVDEQAAAGIVERVRSRPPDEVQFQGSPVHLSAGYIVFTVGRRLDPAVLVAAADQALRAAKQQGRDRAIAAPSISG
jgi:diguanylate cyclase (GGDEF)-like protein